jgi:hypothetical protein
MHEDLAGVGPLLPAPDGTRPRAHGRVLAERASEPLACASDADLLPFGDEPPNVGAPRSSHRADRRSLTAGCPSLKGTEAHRIRPRPAGRDDEELFLRSCSSASMWRRCNARRRVAGGRLGGRQGRSWRWVAALCVFADPALQVIGAAARPNESHLSPSWRRKSGCSSSGGWKHGEVEFVSPALGRTGAALAAADGRVVEDDGVAVAACRNSAPLGMPGQASSSSCCSGHSVASTYRPALLNPV